LICAALAKKAQQIDASRLGKGLKKRHSVKRAPPKPMDAEEAQQRVQRESEEAKKREQQESIWESDESSESESEQDSDEDKEEGWIDRLVETIIELKDYRKREEKIINFLRECLFARIYNMESSFEKRKVRKNEKKKYERLKEALEILDEHYETMIHIMNKGAEYEKMEITNVEDGEYEGDNVDDEDDDMEDDFTSIGEIRKSGGGKA
jgi:hypothetical protein